MSRDITFICSDSISLTRKDFRLVRRSVRGQPFCQAEGEKQRLKKQFPILAESACAQPEVAIGYGCQMFDHCPQPFLRTVMNGTPLRELIAS
jgi:hypothetical protein